MTPVDPAGEAGERSEDAPEETPVPDADSADSGVHIGNFFMLIFLLLFKSIHIQSFNFFLPDPFILSSGSFNFFLPDPSISFFRVLHSPVAFFSFSRIRQFILLDTSILCIYILLFSSPLTSYFIHLYSILFFLLHFLLFLFIFIHYFSSFSWSLCSY